MQSARTTAERLRASCPQPESESISTSSNYAVVWKRPRENGASMSVERISRTARKIRASWGGDEGRRGFTLVELLIVIILSAIILAGMVALISSVFNVFTQSKNLQALND